MAETSAAAPEGGRLYLLLPALTFEIPAEHFLLGVFDMFPIMFCMLLHMDYCSSHFALCSKPMICTDLKFYMPQRIHFHGCRFE